MVEATVKARSLGFNQILFLSDSRRSVQVVNKERAPSWKEKTWVADCSHLAQNGLIYHSVFVPRIVKVMSIQCCMVKQCQYIAVWLNKVFL